MKLTSLLFFILFAITVNAQLFQKWVGRYTTNTGVVGHDYDEAYSVEIDNSGFVYTTGAAYETVANGRDIVTIKYNPDGTEAWIAKYNSPSNNHDQGNFVKVDNQGNVIVVGQASYDMVILKYNASGTLLWSQIYNGSGGSFDNGKALILDNAGNIYVAGEQESSGQSFNIVVMEYNPDGVQQWATIYNGTGNYDDYSNAITLDSQGNVYVAGEVRESGGSKKDFVTLKLNSAGAIQWAKEGGAPNEDDMAYGVVVDNLGNVYVAGKGNDVESDFLTIKYDASGNQLWSVQYNGPGNYESATDLILDDNNNVIVAGQSNATFNSMDYTIIKYSTDGAQIWLKTWSGPGAGHDDLWALVKGNDGKFYVTGSSTGIARDYATVCWDFDGNQLGAARYDNGNHDEASSIAVNSSGTVAVCGYSIGSGTGRDYATVVYSPTPTGVHDEEMIPTTLSLEQNYPNPFNPSTVIRYGIAETGVYSLKVFNILGQEIQVLKQGILENGNHEISFNASHLAGGVYIYQLTGANTHISRKMILAK